VKEKKSARREREAGERETRERDERESQEERGGMCVKGASQRDYEKKSERERERETEK